MRDRLICLALFLATACSGGEENTPPPDPVYSLVLSGVPRGDTIDAFINQPLVATVTVDSAPAIDVQVRFRVVGCSDRCTRVAHPGGYFTSLINASTDSNGQAMASVRLGRTKGTALVAVEVVDHNVADTGSYQVLTGQPDSLVVASPVDTALLADSSLVIDARVVDRGGNTVLVPVGVDVLDENVLARNGNRLTATNYGSTQVKAFASVGLQFEQVVRFVAVVPPGQLALTAPDGSIEVANTDGSKRRAIGRQGSTAAWSPDGRRVAYVNSTGQLLLQHDLDHGELALVSSTFGEVNTLQFPSYSRDDAWVYFSGWPNVLAQANWEVWRVRPDGRNLERVGQPGRDADGDVGPSPAPDGNRVVWATTRGTAVSHLAIHDLTTGTTSDIPGALGYLPAWSPVGGRIAYLSGDPALALYVIDESGGPFRHLVPGTFFEYSPVGWSPDGQWIVATSYMLPMAAVLVRVSDGMLIQLPWAKDRRASSWAAGALE